MSTPTNRIVREISKKSLFPSALKVINSSLSYNQGDLLVFDDTNNVLKVPTAEAQGSTFLGIAENTIVSGREKSPVQGTAVDSSVAITDIAGPAYGVVAKLFLKSGDVIAPGDSVYLDPASGAQNVSVTGTKAIGVYQGKALTATSTTEIEVLLGCRHPSDTLQF